MRYIFILLILASSASFAQIGIQTEQPSQFLHIDAAKNNNNSIPTTATQIEDDIVITSDGKLGVGTTTPLEKLDINGSIKIVDGNQALGKKLITDVNGLATWSDVIANKYAVWDLRSSGNFSFPGVGTVVPLTGTSSMIWNQIDGVRAVTNGVVIPKGKYIVLTNGDVVGIAEYCIFYLYANTQNVYTAYYSEWLGGGTFTLDLAAEATITLRWSGLSTGGVYYSTPPYQWPFWYQLSFIQLSN
jgi:hypothetical protein